MNIAHASIDTDSNSVSDYNSWVRKNTVSKQIELENLGCTA